MKRIFIIFIFVLVTGLLSACGSQSAETPVSPPTEEPAPATESPAPTDTAIPLQEAPATEAAPVAATVSFANDIAPLLKSRCGNCHGGREVEEGLSVLTYEDLLKGSDNGFVVTPGSADTSLLVEMILSQDMPKRGPKLTPPQVQLIVDWINQGALNN